MTTTLPRPALQCPAAAPARRRPGALAGALLLMVSLALAPAMSVAQSAPAARPLPVQQQGPAPGDAKDEDLSSGFSDHPAEAFSEEAFDLKLPEEPAAAGSSNEASAAPSFWALHGFARLDSAYAYQHEAPPSGAPDWRGLAKLRAALQLELELELGAGWQALISAQGFHDLAYGLKQRDTFSDELLALYEQEAEFRETYVRGSLLRNLDLKVGRQIVVWGYADQLRVVDVLNPLDNREPGLVDVEDIRLPLTMTRLDLYLGDWSLMAVAVHEIRFNKEPVYGSDYFPLPVPLPRDEVPSDGGQNTEYGLAAQGVFSGWDLALYWAQFFDDAAHLEGRLTPRGFLPLQRAHSRLTLGGVAVRVALGNILLKTERAHVAGLQFALLPGETRARLDALLGFEYSGITDTTLGVEALGRHLLAFDPLIEASPDGQPQDVNQYQLSYRSDWMNQRLHLVAVAALFGQSTDQGSMQRYAVTYDVFDAFALTGGVLMYQSAGAENFILQAARDNDRLFFEAKYSF